MGRHKPSYACVNHSDASMISVPVKYYACLFFLLYLVAIFLCTFCILLLPFLFAVEMPKVPVSMHPCKILCRLSQNLASLVLGS